MTSISGMPVSLVTLPASAASPAPPNTEWAATRAAPTGAIEARTSGYHHRTQNRYPCRGNPCGCPSPFTVTNASIAGPRVAHAPPIWWLTAHPAESGLLRQAPRIALRIGAVAARHQQRDPPPGAQSAPGQRRRTRDAGQDRRTRRSLGDSAVQTAPLCLRHLPPLAERGERGTDLFRGSLAVFGERRTFRRGRFPSGGSAAYRRSCGPGRRPTRRLGTRARR